MLDGDNAKGPIFNRSVVGTDLRNHGDSPHANTHTYPELAADVVQLMGKLTISKCSFIGHSMGGRTAMAVALTEVSIGYFAPLP